MPRRFLGAEVTSALEYVLSGSKSPANPWHGEADPNETRMFDEPVLEHTVAAEAAAVWPWRKWRFSTRLKLGAVFNRLELGPAADGGPGCSPAAGRAPAHVRIDGRGRICMGERPERLLTGR